MGFEHGHYKVVCNCGKIIEQCRCLHPWKHVRHGECDECKAKAVKKSITDSATNISIQTAALIANKR